MKADLHGRFFCINYKKKENMADGLAYGNRVSNFSHSAVHGVVLDTILNTPTFWSRINGMGVKFDYPTKKYTVKVSRTGQGQTFVGLEKLNASASDTTIQLEYNHVGYTHPAVKVMLEHFAQEGKGADINLSDFINEEVIAEILEDLGSKIYGAGAGNNINGLEKIVDDGTTSDIIGGQSRSTYSQLNSTVTASGGTLSLAKMSALWTAVTSGTKKPTIAVTTEEIFNLVEELIQPQTRGSYDAHGYMPIRGKAVKARTSDSFGEAGFTSLVYRGVPIIADEFATTGVLYLLNENHLTWAGRTNVPTDFKKAGISPVSLGKMSSLDVNYDKPGDFHGWFYQKEQMMPDQAGLFGRYYVIGQVCSDNPRRHGKLTGITGV